MKKTKLTRSLLAACSIVALSAVMYGCTSDGSKDDLIATQEALDQEKEAHAATQTALDTANGEVTRLTGELDTANGEVTRLTGELATAEGDASGLQTQLTAAQGEVTRLEGELTTAEGERDSYKGMVADAEREAEKLRREKAAMAASEKAAEVLKSLMTLSGTEPTITLSASSGGTLTAKAAAYTMSGTAPDRISGFRGAILTKSGNEAHVYTDIDDATATPIDGIYSASSDPGKAKTYSVTTDGGMNSINWEDVDRADETSTTTGTGETRMTTFAGDVLGLAGTFTCTGTTCMAPTEDSESASLPARRGGRSHQPVRAAGSTLPMTTATSCSVGG